MGERVRIGASYSFEAAHWLPNVPDGHKCKRLHGHNYRVDVLIDGSLDPRGFVMDYAELDAVVQPLIDRLDHRCLNDLPGLANPTSEVLALWLRDSIKAALPGYAPVIRIWETPRYWVEVS
ncbi:MAG TPA: 6-carboxytetrahydropterin synthase QueD [Hyphomicrobium sp.]|nr:6-carboxytetrahydropterin synthase QueD [Hyphomicrobium sp.]